MSLSCPQDNMHQLSAMVARNSQQVYCESHSKPSPPLHQVNNRRKDPGKLWSGGSTPADSLSRNEGTITEPTSTRTTVAQYFRTQINPTHTDILLIICGFVSGLVDGFAFNAWASFASMQTGTDLSHVLGAEEPQTDNPRQETPYS
jgi:hypothetical protein